MAVTGRGEGKKRVVWASREEGAPMSRPIPL